MINKTRLGISVVDESIGGVYRKRPVLCYGRRGSGKTIMALHCLKQSVEEGENVLLLSSWNPRDLAIVSQKVLSFSCDKAVKSGNATLLEYAGIMASPVFEEDVTLPPDSFNELIEIVMAKSITRVIIDTVLPWVAIRQKDRLAKHIFSFVHAFDRMGVTAIFTLPKPASPLAFMLKNLLEDSVPVSLSLDVDDAGIRTLNVHKYLGESVMPAPMPFLIVPGTGIVSLKSTPGPLAANPVSPPLQQAPASVAPVAEAAPVNAAPAPAAPPAAKPKTPIRFAAAFKNT
jgi:KaiC/GvpD/RAD55 family RecA-like ATPase